MPTFEIPDGPTTIEAVRSGDAQNPKPAQASAAYSVTNKGSDSVDGRVGVVVSGASKAEWFSIDGDRERTFAAGETQTATVRVSFPPDAPAGDYPFRLRAVAINDPDNDHAEGPVTTARLAGVGEVIKKKSWLWLWILLGVLALIAIAVVLYLVLRPDPVERAQERAAEWANASAGGNVEALTAMSDPPFFLDDGGALQNQSDIQNKYRAKLVPAPDQLPPGTDAKDKGETHVGFDAVVAQRVADYRVSVGSNAELDRVVREMRLGDDDIVIIGNTRGVRTILFFRRKGVKLAGVVD